MIGFTFTDIPISRIVHNDLELYIKSGYGGKRIKDWPFYNFIELWINGKHDKSKKLWVSWLVDEFSKYCLNLKSKGGMFQGSVHKYALISITENKNKFWSKPSELRKVNIVNGAKILVDRRVEMIQSIVNKGYKASVKDPIIAVRKGNTFVLKGGHHRASIMHILGYNKLPGVIVYSKHMWELRKWLVKIKKLLNLKI